MRKACALLILALLPQQPAPALGQSEVRQLQGIVFSTEKGKGREIPLYLPSVTVTIVDFHVSDRTTDSGNFIIQFPAPVQAGREVKLQVEKKGYAIYSPWEGKQFIPADSTKVVEIRMLPERSPLFETHEALWS